jgi:MFS family permease
MGPCLGPLFGGWISYRTGQWRWVYWVLFIIVGAVFALTLVMPETLSTIILKKKAAKLNKGNDSNICITESDLHVIPLSSRLKTAMLRPFILMFMEPIVLFMSFYLSFVYSLLYATFFAFPIAFEEIRGWNAGMTGVSFVSIIVSYQFIALSARKARIRAHCIGRHSWGFGSDANPRTTIRSQTWISRVQIIPNDVGRHVSLWHALSRIGN